MVASVPYRARLAIVLATGLGIRLWLTFDTHGLQFDLQSYALVDHALGRHPLHVYSLVNPPALLRWPYPSGFFAFLPVIQGLSRLTGLAFTELVRLPSVLADLAIAWLVQDFLARRGCSERVRLAAAGMVALGPLFIANSGYDGQLDSLAILPAALGLVVWERSAIGGGRAVLAGALIGLGAGLKSFPLLVVIALLPSCRSRREGASLVVAALVIPLLALAPFLIADGHAVVAALKYHSLVGTGGLSLVAQPNLAGIWLGGPFHPLSSISHSLQRTPGLAITVVGVAGAGLLVMRFRARPRDAASLLWLAVFAFSINFGPRYAIWGIPFFLMRRHLWSVLAIQLLLIVPTILLRASPFSNHDVVYIYAVTMIVAWLGFLVAAVILARQLALEGRLRLDRRRLIAAS